jgi:hypothetical protein
MSLSEISGSNRAVQDTINAVGPVATLMLPVSGFGAAGFSLAPGTLSAAMRPEVSFDGKDTWWPWAFEDPLTGSVLSSLVVTSPNAARSLSIRPPGGTTHVRINVTAYTSGSATAILVLTEVAALSLRPTTLPSFVSVYRSAARPYALSSAMGANSRKQYATIHHAASAAKNVRLRHVWMAIESSSANNIVVAELRRITAAPATGNPTITPGPDSAADAVEATCLALPTTPGTEAGLLSMLEWDFTRGPAASYPMPPPALQWTDLLSPSLGGYSPDVERRLPTIRAGVLEGYAVTLDVAVAATIKGYIEIEFTEWP